MCNTKKTETAIQNEKDLQNNSYPGRGIIIGESPDAKNYIQIYWIMGRSSGSRNRVFLQEGDFVKTEAFDPSILKNPSLYVYYPIKQLGQVHIVTNGDQTDTILVFLKEGKTFMQALKTRTFEEDPPINTPRISGQIDCNQNGYDLSILKMDGGNPDNCYRGFYHYSTFIPGFGHCIHTYAGDGNPVPSFYGEPRLVRLFDDIEENLTHYWNVLNEENKVSLLVKFIHKETGKSVIQTINKQNHSF